MTAAAGRWRVALQSAHAPTAAVVARPGLLDHLYLAGGAVPFRARESKKTFWPLIFTMKNGFVAS